MGNEHGRPSGKLGISALATVSTIEPPLVNILRDSLWEAAKTTAHFETISRSDLTDTLKRTNLLETDAEILDKLFTMFDLSGEQTVHFKDFLAAVCLLTSGSVQDKLILSISMYDIGYYSTTAEKRTISETVTRSDLKKALLAVNTAASYFGDPVLKDDEINTIIVELYKKLGSSTANFRYREYADEVCGHRFGVTFVSGQGTVRFGAR